MTMTTERKRPTARLNLSSNEWKLYLVAALGAAYSVAWSVASKAPATAAAAPDATQPVVVWVSDPMLLGSQGMPASQVPVAAARPAVAAPAGASITNLPPLPAAPRAATRIRTRSS